MLQTILVFVIVFGTLAYIIYSSYKSLSVKKVSKCEGCSGCEIKTLYANKQIGNC